MSGEADFSKIDTSGIVPGVAVHCRTKQDCFQIKQFMGWNKNSVFEGSGNEAWKYIFPAPESKSGYLTVSFSTLLPSGTKVVEFSDLFADKSLVPDFGLGPAALMTDLTNMDLPLLDDSDDLTPDFVRAELEEDDLDINLDISILPKSPTEKTLFADEEIEISLDGEAEFEDEDDNLDFDMELNLDLDPFVWRPGTEPEGKAPVVPEDDSQVYVRSEPDLPFVSAPEVVEEQPATRPALEVIEPVVEEQNFIWNTDVEEPIDVVFDTGGGVKDLWNTDTVSGTEVEPESSLWTTPSAPEKVEAESSLWTTPGPDNDKEKSLEKSLWDSAAAPELPITESTPGDSVPPSVEVLDTSEMLWLQEKADIQAQQAAEAVQPESSVQPQAQPEFSVQPQPKFPAQQVQPQPEFPVQPQTRQQPEFPAQQVQPEFPVQPQMRQQPEFPVQSQPVPPTPAPTASAPAEQLSAAALRFLRHNPGLPCAQIEGVAPDTKSITAVPATDFPIPAPEVTEPVSATETFANVFTPEPVASLSTQEPIAETYPNIPEKETEISIEPIISEVDDGYEEALATLTAASVDTAAVESLATAINMRKDREEPMDYQNNGEQSLLSQLLGVPDDQEFTRWSEPHKVFRIRNGRREFRMVENNFWSPCPEDNTLLALLSNRAETVPLNGFSTDSVNLAEASIKLGFDKVKRDGGLYLVHTDNITQLKIADSLFPELKESDRIHLHIVSVFAVTP
jgi:hypothetical protein